MDERVDAPPWPPQRPIFALSSRGELFRRRSIFLSASVPYPKDFPDDPRRQELNDEDNATAHPRRIMTAVSYLAQDCILRDFNIVFGAHPAISPMVLDIARRFAKNDESRVLCFQSCFFSVEQIPRPTWDFYHLPFGEILWTDAKPNGPGSTPDLTESLTEMRASMLSIPNLAAAVLIGGMDGVDQEAELFSAEQNDAPVYAIASTGGAALRLFKADQHRFRGRDKQTIGPILEREVSYPVVIDAIFKDIG